MKLFESDKAVAIDGPAGSGKSTVSRLAAQKLGYVYIDTGAMYRALTLKVMRKNISFDNEVEIILLSSDLDFELVPGGNKDSLAVLLDSEDVSEDIRKIEVTNNVKFIARIPAVRSNLVDLQRKMVNDINGAVMEGRDIGTVVLPGARFKFYIDASFEERVERRWAELRGKGHPVPREAVADDLKKRDHSDKTRKVGPLKKADDAIVIDTTNLDIEEVVAVIVEKIRN